jgi:hypothetical protein
MSTSFIWFPIFYSLVVTGETEFFQFETRSQLFNCPTNSTGAFYQIKVEPLKLNSSIKYTLAPFERKVYSFTFQELSGKQSIILDIKTPSKFVILEISRKQLSKYGGSFLNLVSLKTNQQHFTVHWLKPVYWVHNYYWKWSKQISFSPWNSLYNKIHTYLPIFIFTAINTFLSF